LEQFKESSGREPDGLIPPDVPYGFMYIWDWFTELNNGRQNSGFGPMPISYLEIHSWSELTKSYINPWEIEVIKEMDSAYIASRVNN